MRQYLITMIVAVSALLLSCTTADLPNGAATTDLADGDLKQANLTIEGMSCSSCALGVEYQLKQVDGVTDAKVDWKKGTGIVTYDPSKVQPEDIAKASTTYSATLMRED